MFRLTLKTIEGKEGVLKDTKKIQKEKERELEQKVEEKKKTFTEMEARELILKKFYDGIRFQLERYLGNEEKKIVSSLVKLWDKYHISFSTILNERDKSIKKLNGFLDKLGYLK